MNFQDVTQVVLYSNVLVMTIFSTITVSLDVHVHTNRYKLTNDPCVCPRTHVPRSLVTRQIDPTLMAL